MTNHDAKKAHGHTTEPRTGGQQLDEGNRQEGGKTARNDNEQSGRPRDDGRHDTDLDDDRSDQRMAAQQHANRQAAESNAQDGEQIDHGSQARAGMGKARQSDGS